MKKKGPLHGARHGNTERQRIYHAVHIAAKRAKKKGYYSILERFRTCTIYRASARDWMGRSLLHTNEDHTYVCTAEEHKRRENSWVLVLNSQEKNGPMKQREDYAEATKIKERLHIPANKYGKERINRSRDSVKEPNELTRKLDGNGILLLPHQAHLRHGGNHQSNCGRHRVGINRELFYFFLNLNCKVFRLQAIAIPL